MVGLFRLIFVEASAKTAQNVEEAFFETGRKIVDMIKSGELNVKDESSGVQEGMKLTGGKGGKNGKRGNRSSGCCA